MMSTCRLLLPIFLLLHAPVCPAQQPSPEVDISQQTETPKPAPSSTVSEMVDNGTEAIEQFERRLTELSNSVTTATVDDETRQQLQQLINQATADLKSARDQQQTIATISARTESLAEEATTLKAPATPSATTDAKALSRPEIETQIAAMQVRLAGERQKLATLEQKAADPAARKQELQQSVAAAQKAIQDLTVQLESLPSDSEELATQITRQAALIRRQRYQNDLTVAKATLANLDAEVAMTLPALRVAQQKRIVTGVTTQLDNLQKELERRRQMESAEQLAKAQEAQQGIAELQTQELRDLQEQRTEYAELNRRIASERIPEVERLLKRKTASIDRLQNEATKIKERIERFGTDGTIGRDLLHFKDQFPRMSDIENEMSKTDVELSDLRRQQIDIAEESDEVQDLMARPADGFNSAERELIEGHQQVLQTLSENTMRLSSLLSDLDGENRRLLSVVREWQEYASEQSLWFRSHEPLTGQDLKDIPQELVSAANQVLETLQNAWHVRWTPILLISLPAAAAFILLLVVQKRAQAEIAECCALASRRSCISLQPTIRTLLLTFAVAAEWPMLCVLTGCLFRFAVGQPVLLQVGTGLIHFGGISLWLNCWRHAVGSDRLAASHLSWNPSVCSVLRRWLRNVFTLTSLPMLLFLIARQGGSPGDLLERFLFIVLMASASLVVMKLVLPASNPFVKHIASYSTVLQRLPWIWIGLPVVLPVVLGTLSFFGYHYTAVQLMMRIGWTLAILSLVLLTHGILNRWLQVSKTRTRLQQAKDRAMDRDRQQDSESPAEVIQTSIPPVAEEEQDFEVFGLQAKSLLRNIAVFVAIAAIWGIWFDVLPALRVLDREPIWYVNETVIVPDPAAPDSAGKSEIVRRPVTVGSLLMVLFTLALTTVSVRQLPGLIEVVLASQGGLDRGIRYAVSTVTRYLLLLIGLVFSFQFLGLRWTQVQWLLAGLSVGLGFGLQEVFANFVCGLIILLERPVRIGDIVTIDGVSGVVSRIRIRATSITDWDRREYIVPNREFVTGKLLNWTLSDTTNRIMINVGVAYGTDTDRARQVMLEVAQAHKEVMKDPPPVATFEKFGDSALELVLRAYLPSLDNRLTTITEIHTEINRRFTEERISIPFPQRDVHMFVNSLPSIPKS
ncbi:MAG: mechanosensitive ion channel [Planctomycetaceae bacterium]|nr:mechanosensitive ion channel [Planctomycetaceae bacterium]